MGEEVGTMQFRVQGEQIKKNKESKKRKKKYMYKKKIYMSIYDTNKVNSTVL
jgi:hypothetical protein